MKVYLNGVIVDEGAAFLPVNDRGILFGDGLFETIRAYGGRPFRLERHMARLREGCRTLRLAGIPGDEEVRRAIGELYAANVREGDAYVRITVTGGAFDGSRTLRRSGPPNVFIVVKPLEPYPEEYYSHGLRLTVSRIRRNATSPLVRVKTNNYLESLFARQEAVEAGFHDALFLNTYGHLAEATTSNIFLVSDGEVCTPHLECGVLPGITREAVLEICQDLEIPTETGFYTLDELFSAQEAFLTMSTGEIIPVREVDGSRLGESCPGPVTARLIQAFHELVKSPGPEI